MDSIIVVGLGSMGKRRIRCLRSLGLENIVGVDIREDRRLETKEQFGITTLSDLDSLQCKKNIRFLVNSLPPDRHNIATLWCLKNNIYCFVEAGVVTEQVKALLDTNLNTDLVIPSATFLFHPAIEIVSEVVKTKKLGKLSNIIYHSGHYLPYWHKYENVADYYVSNRETGGAREIVPFELTWLTKVFGMPKRVSSMATRTIAIDGAPNIDDTYNILLAYKDFISSLTVDVVSRSSTRRLMINGDRRQLIWNWNDNFISIYDDDEKEPNIIRYTRSDAADGYNENIGEEMYIKELRSFIDHINGKGNFPNSLKEDYKVLSLLLEIEENNLLKSELFI